MGVAGVVIAADEDVLTGASGNGIGPEPADEERIARAGPKGVVTRVAEELIPPGAADEQVVPRAAVEYAGALAGPQGVVARPP